MSDHKVERVHDYELEKATGGDRCEWLEDNTDRYVDDSRGRCCGQYRNDVLYYWPCKKCGRPTHMGSGFHQCDKCDDWFWSISHTRYYGTEERLKSESAAN